MPFRKLAGFNKNGAVWVAPELPKRIQVRIRRHEKTFQRKRLQGQTRAEAIEAALKAEHRGLTKHERILYDLKVARLTKKLPVRVSYSSARKN